MVRTGLLAIFLFIGLVHAQTGIGNREAGDQLIYVKYLQEESSVPANLLLHFWYDGRPNINRISAVECFEQSVRSQDEHFPNLHSNFQFNN
jgi:hypothetical protein